MCGIAGFVSQTPLSNRDRAGVSAMNAAMIHRGPDGEGEFTASHAMLAMRRLSIIDLEGGWQPFFNGDRSLALIVNGEIYNAPELRAKLEARGHRFRTNSDCEVILHLYEDAGNACVDGLRGMFAFALWDEKKQRLVLGRDRMGEKPLYLYEDGHTLLFASELQTLVSSGRVPVDIDIQSTDRYFHYGFIPEPVTALAGVRKLPAAHVMTVDVRDWKIESKPYWDLKDAPPLDGNPAELVRAALDDVFDHVARADTPVGVALSGGIDSSAIAALCVQKGYDISAFSVGYPGAPGSDERAFAREYAGRLGIPFHDVELGHDRMIADFPNVAMWRDDPIADLAGYGYYSVNRLAREHEVPVMMQGQGADELFWGYDWTVQAVRESAEKAVGRAVGLRALGQEIGRALPWGLTRAEIGHFIRSRAGLSAMLQRRQRNRMLPDERLIFFDVTAGYRTYESMRGDLLTDLALARQGVSAATAFTVERPWNDLETTLTDVICRTYLRENGIAQGDRLSMRSSVEMRLPFVDHHLVETVIGLRKTQPDSGLGLKRHLKDALRDVLPEEILNRRKRGFAPPVAAWHRGLMDAYGESLADGHLVAAGFLKREAAHELALARPGIRFDSVVAFRALAFEKWFEGLSSLAPPAGAGSPTRVQDREDRVVAVAITCFNRRETTLTCLRALAGQKLPPGYRLNIYLTDDGCTDGTAAAVSAEFPEVRILEGDGSLFWNGGMRRALGEAMADSADYYLWLNDDTTLDADAIEKMLTTVADISINTRGAAIVVGTPANPDGGVPVYGGTRRKSVLKPLRFTRITPEREPVSCDTFDGNCILVTAAAADRLGNLDPAFTHRMGDTDYGLRAGQAKIPIWIAPGTVGVCPPNPVGERHRDKRLGLPRQIASIFDVKGLPVREWKIIAKRHAGPFWALFWISPYIRFFLEAVFSNKRTARKT